MTQSVLDPATHFTIVQRANRKPTGEVECDCCGQRALDVREIDHADGCPQADVEF